MIDVQAMYEERQIPINEVGVTNLTIPFRIKRRKERTDRIPCNVTISCSLIETQKGAHMSRFVSLLHEYSEQIIDYSTLHRLLLETNSLLDTESSKLKMEFVLFIKKFTPITKLENYLNYNCSLEGENIDGKVRIFLSVEVPVMSLCPASKLISDFNAHSQRSKISLKIELLEDCIWFEDLIEIAERSCSQELYSLLKREDEKFVTENSYSRAKFVEDMIRDVAHELRTMPFIGYWTAHCINFESIHNHDVYAIIKAGDCNA